MPQGHSIHAVRSSALWRELAAETVVAGLPPLCELIARNELDREWDIDRVLMANFAVLGGATYGVGLARYFHTPLFARRRTGLLYFFGAQLGFLLLHASVGWCPPASLWRWLGVRTKAEIDLERTMLETAIERPLTAGESPAVHTFERGAPKSVPQAVS